MPRSDSLTNLIGTTPPRPRDAASALTRRAFLALGLLASPIAAGAQPAPRVFKIGLVSLGTDPARPRGWEPFMDAMRTLGYVEGQNLSIRRAFAGGRSEPLAGLVGNLVREGVDVIVTTGPRETLAAKQATSTIPIVMTSVPDPVAQGFIASLGRPQGNVTGLTNLVPGLSQKYVELLREALPSARRVGVVTSPPNPSAEHRRELDEAVRAFGMSFTVIPVQGLADFEPALAKAKADGVAAIIASPDGVTLLHRRALVQLALKHRLPGIYWAREYVEEGGLMTYGASLQALRRRAAAYVDKLLKGARPADLPVEQPTTFELVVNLRTARAMALTLPPRLLQRADDVIE